MIGVWIAILVIAAILLLAFIKANLKISHPNEILVFSGRKRRLKDGTVVGYRIIKGGRGFKIPIIESTTTMPLTAIPIEIRLSGALTGGVIPINVQAQANVKVAGTEEEGLFNALERFLGRGVDDVSRVAKEVLEGSIRGVLSTLTPEEANSQRLEFSKRVSGDARSDLAKLGLVLDTLKIKSISDDEGYLEAIGRKKNAEVRRDATMAEANAESEARIVAAAAKEKGAVAEYEAEMNIADAENGLRVKRAELAARSNSVESRAEVAGDIARVEEEEKLEARRVEMNKKKYEAEVIVPAMAEKEALTLKAVGDASRISENGRATAEAVRVLREQWEKEETRELFLIQQLPDILDKVTRVISENLAIEKVTVLDNGDGGGMPAYIKGVTGSIVAVMEQIKSATGLDITEILKAEKKAPGRA